MSIVWVLQYKLNIPSMFVLLKRIHFIYIKLQNDHYSITDATPNTVDSSYSKQSKSLAPIKDAHTNQKTN